MNDYDVRPGQLTSLSSFTDGIQTTLFYVPMKLLVNCIPAIMGNEVFRVKFLKVTSDRFK